MESVREKRIDHGSVEPNWGAVRAWLLRGRERARARGREKERGGEGEGERD